MVDEFLYLLEVLYVLFFIWLTCSGPGNLSVELDRRQVTDVIDRRIFESPEG